MVQYVFVYQYFDLYIEFSQNSILRYTTMCLPLFFCFKKAICLKRNDLKCIYICGSSNVLGVDNMSNRSRMLFPWDIIFFVFVKTMRTKTKRNISVSRTTLFTQTSDILFKIISTS